jgi:hypothetical protein
VLRSSSFGAGAILIPMASQKGVDRPNALADLPSEVRVTVRVIGRAHPLHERVAKLWAATLAHWRVTLASAILLSAVIVAAALLNNTGARSGHPARAASAGTAGIAAAYGHPPGRLSITISASDPAYARADIKLGNGCGRYCAYDGAVLHRVGDLWRIVLDTVNYSCPVASLPARVQAELALCPLTGTSAGRLPSR